MRLPSFKLGDEDSPINELIGLAERVVEERLTADRSSGALEKAVQEIFTMGEVRQSRLMSSIEQATSSEPAGQIKCTVGCCHCCYRVPELSIPELALVWNYLSGFSRESREDLQARVEAFMFRSTVSPCPLLVDGQCTVYEVRPLSCRGLNSTDVGACESIRRGTKSPADRPKWADLVVLSMALRMGIRLGAFFESLSPATVSLAHALQILFRQPDALEHYVKGKDCFGPAYSGSECEPFDSDPIASSNGPAYASQEELRLPSGNLDIAEASFLKQQASSYLDDGDFARYRGSIGGQSVGRMMARINVPRAAMSEDEIDESRSNYLLAMREFERAGFSPEEAFNALSFHQTMNLAYQGRDDLEILREHGRFVVEGISRKALPQFAEAPDGKRKPGKLRVGYLSGHFNSSNNGRWVWPWIRHHSDEIEAFCLFVGTKADRLTDLFRGYSEHFYWLNRSVSQNAAFVRSLGLDVLIFPEIGVYARSTQYSSLRLAPVQCTAWGGPETSGLDTIDYYLSSEFMEPSDGDRSYSEKLVRLPRSGLTLYRDPTPIPDRNRAYFGLAESGPILLMAQACMKLVPRFDPVFARICERASAEIVFLESDPAGDSKVVKARLEKAGVRARWIPAVSSADYLALLRLADVSIDPHMWSGGNTTVQSLTVGSPVVTWPGPFMRSRHSLGFLRQANAAGLVAEDEDGFVDLACDFERHREAMRGMDAGALYGDLGVVKALDDFLFSVGHS